MQQDINSIEYLIGQYQRLHQEAHAFRGKMVPVLVNRVMALVKEHGAKTLLDYGCGKAQHYDVEKVHRPWGIKPTCYDPAYPPYSKKPETSFDGVICNDVAEHIPEQHVDWFLADVLSYAEKFALMCIFTEKAKAVLPDGRNAHLTIKSAEWWNRRIFNLLGGFEHGVRPLDWSAKKGFTEFMCPKLYVVVYYRTKSNKKLVQ